MRVNEYIGDQFSKTVFTGNEIDCKKEKERLEKERANYLEEYKRICKDKLFMDINYKLA